MDHDVGAYPPDNGRNFDEYAVVSEMVRDRTSISMNHIKSHRGLRAFVLNAN